MNPETITWLGLGLALIYLPLSGAPASAPRSVVKTLPLLGFSAAAFLAGGPAFLTVGLFLSALGDFALSRRGQAAFLYGLSAFALAHLVYILHFLALSEGQIWDSFALFPLLSLFLVFVTLSTEIWLAPHVGPLRWPVRVYVVLITGMGLAALTLPMGLIALGSGLFILSDLILALQLFRMGEDHPLVGPAGWALWVFYVAGQALILTGGLAGPLP